MQISSDYRDLFRIFNKYRVKYLVVGAYAVAYYAQPRFTKDLDIWISPDSKNAQRVFNALKEFGAPLKGIQPSDFTNPRIIYQIGVAPVRIDIMLSIPGVKFKQAWEKRKKAKYADVRINLIGKAELIRSKKKLAREQDLLDVKRLSASGF